MKIKDGYLLRKVGKDYVVMSTSEDVSFNGMLSLNEVGSFIFKSLSEDNITLDDLVIKITNRYEIDENTARIDASEFIKVLKENNILDD